MQIYQIEYPISQDNFQPSVIAIGYFDGVHLGHQQVISRACEKANELNLPCGVMTFSPHPKEVLGIGAKIDQITPLESKLKLFEKMGIDICYIVHFTKHFAAITPEQFIEDILIKLNVKGVVVGFDYTFGDKGVGNPETLRDYAEGRYTVDIIEPIFDQGKKVSSTRIRNLLASGKVSEVKRLLGRNYSFLGKVIHGQKLGRTIGFPTANLELLEHYTLIKNGVYVVRVKNKGRSFLGLMNVGFKPTVNDKKVTSYEIHILDFNEDIYGQVLEVELLEYIREEIKFKNIDQLKEQIKKDLFSLHSWYNYAILHKG
ncbi:riboflavin biosynthesis protein RibF [Vulcanibacillus modesticaldus]|uniref:Riboflavin biosynthesis protein n=1 Tax=Vulcanibacillus modesticaldus TaxID=337097 RepID=A0A1D2YXY6_9BACI|nr:bifunctional riboflavin kinase/FAD synthetase [Vulcanibacillus modesticaldus]OEG00446.1 riboflavin biosynthesis protein RibF [Vulcanibacillus modesticaldus]